MKSRASKAKAPKPEAPPSRPSAFTTEIADRICERLADGETLRAICRDDDLPAERTVRRWALYDHQGFAQRYERAREIGYLAMFDELLEIADDARHDFIKDEDGRVRTDHEAITRSRLRVDTRKWALAKALPKVFGDKIEATNIHSWQDNDPEVAERRNAALERLGEALRAGMPKAAVIPFKPQAVSAAYPSREDAPESTTFVDPDVPEGYELHSTPDGVEVLYQGARVFTACKREDALCFISQHRKPS